MRCRVRMVLMEHAFGVPVYATAGSAAADIYSAENLPIFPGERGLVKTGLRFELPPGWEIQVRSRSGLAAKHGVLVLNSPGTLDSDYRGELIIVLHNTSDEVFMVTRGMRIAQIVPMEVARLVVDLVKELSETERGEGRFGSTGK